MKQATKKGKSVGKENLDENVDDPPPAQPVKPAKAVKKLPQVQVLGNCIPSMLNAIPDPSLAHP